MNVEAVHMRRSVARSDIDSEFTKRQVQVPRPDGMADEYGIGSYGLGVTDWQNAGYVGY